MTDTTNALRVCLVQVQAFQVRHQPEVLASASTSVARLARPRLPSVPAVSGQVDRVRGVVHCDVDEISGVMAVVETPGTVGILTTDQHL